MAHSGYYPKHSTPKGLISRTFREKYFDYGLNPPDFAKKFNLTTTRLMNWINGINKPKDKELILRIASVIGCPVEKIYE